MNNKIKVLLAEDSMVTRQFLVHLLESDAQLEIVGVVGNGQAAVNFVTANRCDVVLMDIHMPDMDGFEATRRIMETRPLPIVICSATADTKEVAFVFQAMEAGAIACIEKPLGNAGDFEALAARMLETIKLMSEVKVVRRTARARPKCPAVSDDVIKVIGMGASTGGPQVLQAILAGLPRDFPLPILIVQHISRGFLGGMAEWLRQTCDLQIRVATYGARPLPGHVYLAPDDFHMGVAANETILLTREPPESSLRPAVSFLFRSLAAVYGPRAVGVLLTGMGKDGALELRQMKDRGATTIAQDTETSVVHGMPGEAIALGGATLVLPTEKIAETLLGLAGHRAS